MTQNDQNSQNELAHLTADVVAIAEHDDQRYVLLIQRAEDSDAEPGKLALPGGHLDAAILAAAVDQLGQGSSR